MESKGMIAIIIVLLVILIAISAIAVGKGTIINENKTNLNNTSNDTPVFIELNNTNENHKNNTNSTNITTVENETIEPKAGYRLVDLGELKFFMKDSDLNSDDYIGKYDTFPGGNEYGISREKVAFSPIKDYARLTANIAGRNIDFLINIGYDTDDVIEVPFEDEDENVSVEDITIEGHAVKIIKTDKNYSSQGFTEETSSAYFKIKDKYVFVVWEGITEDRYVIESFFKLNR